MHQYRYVQPMGQGRRTHGALITFNTYHKLSRPRCERSPCALGFYVFTTMFCRGTHDHSKHIRVEDWKMKLGVVCAECRESPCRAPGSPSRKNALRRRVPYEDVTYYFISPAFLQSVRLILVRHALQIFPLQRHLALTVSYMRDTNFSYKSSGRTLNAYSNAGNFCRNNLASSEMDYAI